MDTLLDEHVIRIGDVATELCAKGFSHKGRPVRITVYLSEDSPGHYARTLVVELDL